MAIEDLIDDEMDIDLSISREAEVGILQELRGRWLLDYHRMVKSARLNELVENKALADAQREQAKKLVVQLGEIDRQLKELNA